ncbi:hypothetical protein KAR52_03750 [Candidatus Pacearchaeota archaeon]|nr:hypothetical protein [Candidatus Pacearchaeota archaeon]
MMKETYVLIKIKPKYAEQFCIMMVTYREMCNRIQNSENFAKVGEVFSVLGPFDFLLELSGEGEDETKIDEKINKTIFRIRKTLGGYIQETCTLTKFELLDCLKDNTILQQCFNKAKFLETKEKIDGDLNVFSDFFKNEGGFGKLKDLHKELNYDKAEIENRWKKNKCLFSLRDKCKEYLTGGSIDVYLKREFDAKRPGKILSDKAELFHLYGQNWKLVDDLKQYGIYDAETELKIYKINTKDSHILIKVKPAYSQEFFVAMRVFESLCNRAASSQNLAIIDGVFPLLGTFDFLLELSVVGDNQEEKDEKINRTILKIRDTLGSYISETVTIKKFKIPITKKELEKLFEKNMGHKHLAKLPGRNGEKIPDKSNDEKCDLIDICNAETTSLKKLLVSAKTSGIDDLNEQIVNLKNRVKELEQGTKRNNLSIQR